MQSPSNTNRSTQKGRNSMTGPTHSAALTWGVGQGQTLLVTEVVQQGFSPSRQPLGHSATLELLLLLAPLPKLPVQLGCSGAPFLCSSYLSMYTQFPFTFLAPTCRTKCMQNHH